ncbi:MAG: hypothetical protein JKY37_10490 [Nannocystaceae bacterium]|nr:hypothetical protein [Nannocystaceae bacterium]
MIFPPALVLLSVSALAFACASSTPASSTPATITSEPDASSQCDSVSFSPGSEVQPGDDRFVGLQLFVLDTHGPATTSTLPAGVFDAADCKAHACTVLSAPALLGHPGTPMRIEVGNLADDQSFAVDVNGRPRGSTVELEVEMRLLKPSERMSLAFSGILAPGSVTHLGTLRGREASGPEVFAVVTLGTPEDAAEALKAWQIKQ